MTKCFVLLRISRRKCKNVAFLPTVRLPIAFLSTTECVTFIQRDCKRHHSALWADFLCHYMYVTLYNKSLPIWSRLTLVWRSGSLSCGTRRMLCFLYRWHSEDIKNRRFEDCVSKTVLRQRRCLEEGSALGWV